MSRKRHIVSASNSQTVGQRYSQQMKRCEREQLKRSPNQTDEGSLGPDNPSVPKRGTHARVPDNHQDPQDFRRLLRTKHNLSSAGNIGKEGVCEKRMGNVQ